MATIRLKFRSSTVKGRPGSIVILVSHNKKVRQITTEYKIYPEEWEDRNSRVILKNNKRDNYLHEVIRNLSSEQNRLHAIIERWEDEYSEYSLDDLLTEFRLGNKDHTLFVYMENIILRLQQLKHIGTAKNYQAALKSFKRFRKGEDLSIESIDRFILEEYQAYLKSQDLTQNSISFYNRILRAVYNRAVDQELTTDKKPFRTVFVGSEKTVKRAISIHSIKLIRELDLSSQSSLEYARDIFLFLFYCRGMSFVDAAFLKKKDIQNGTLTYHRHKTSQVLHIKMISPIKKIIERYSVQNSPYLLPIIKFGGENERKQYETALRRINHSLKTISSLARLQTPLTTYVARHSWASIAKSKNVPVNIISDALGHDSLATTEIYLAAIDTSTIDKVNDMIIRDLK